jgi:hypothetical protein
MSREMIPVLEDWNLMAVMVPHMRRNTNRGSFARNADNNCRCACRRRGPRTGSGSPGDIAPAWFLFYSFIAERGVDILPATIRFTWMEFRGISIKNIPQNPVC